MMYGSNKKGWLVAYAIQGDGRISCMVRYWDVISFLNWYKKSLFFVKITVTCRLVYVHA